MSTPAQFSVLGPLKSGVETRAFLGCEVIDGVPLPSRPVVIVWLPDDIVSDPKRVARLQRETSFVTQLEHPNIIKVHGLECFEEGWARVVDFVDGEPLSRVAQRAKEEFRPIDPRVAARIVVDVCEAVHYAHEEGQSRFAGRPVVHGGIRPDTLMVTFKGRTKVTGYGASVLAPTQHGTPLRDKFVYFAPEQIIGGKATASPATDIYAIGAVLYELLSGKPPFADDEDPERSVLTGAPPIIDAIGLEGRLGNVAATALAKRGADRFESVELMRDAILAALQAEDQALPSHEEFAEVVNALIPADGPERSSRRELLESAKDPDAATILNASSELPEGVDAKLFARARPVSSVQRPARKREEVTVVDGRPPVAVEVPLRQPLSRDPDTVIEAPVSAVAPAEEEIITQGESAQAPAAPAPVLETTEDVPRVSPGPAVASSPAPQPPAVAPQGHALPQFPQGGLPQAPAQAPAQAPMYAQPPAQAQAPMYAQPPAQAQPPAGYAPAGYPQGPPAPGQPAYVPAPATMPPGQVAAPPGAWAPAQAPAGSVAPQGWQGAPGHPGMQPPWHGAQPTGWAPGQLPPGSMPPGQMPQGTIPPGGHTPSGGRPAPQGFKPSAARSAAPQNYLAAAAPSPADPQDALLANQPVAGLPPPPKPQKRSAVRSNSQITQFNKKAGDSSRSFMFLALAALVGLAVFTFISKEPPKGLDAPSERHSLPKELVEAALHKTKAPDPAVEDDDPVAALAEAASGADAGLAPESSSDLDAGPVAPPKPGRLRLDSDPQVTVYNGRESLGRTPLTVTLPPGKYRLRFTDSKTGINTYKTYRVSPDGDHRHDLTFGTSQLTVSAPDGAIISLNGRKLGKAPLEPVSIYEGDYLLKVQFEGMSWSERFNAPPGQRIDFKVNLK